MKKIAACVFGLFLAVFARGQSSSNVGTLVNNGDTVAVVSQGTVGVAITGTFTMTVNFEGTGDNVNWFPIVTTNCANGTLVTSTTVTGMYQMPANGMRQVRTRASLASSGSAIINMYSLLGATGGTSLYNGGSGIYLRLDGSVPMQGNLDLGGNNLLNVGSATFGSLVFDSTVATATPPNNDVAINATRYTSASKVFASFKDPEGMTWLMQTALWQGNWGLYYPQTNAVDTGLGELANRSAFGTETTETWANTNRYTRTHFGKWASAAGANAGAGIQSNGTAGGGNQFRVGNAAGQGGGLFYYTKFAVNVWTAADVAFFGMSSAGSMGTSADPGASAGSYIGIGIDHLDTVFTLYTRDGTTLTKTTLSGVQTVTTTATGCTSIPTIAFSGGTGGGAVAHCTLAGGVPTIIVDDSGLYTVAPTGTLSSAGCSTTTTTVNLSSMPAPGSVAGSVPVDFFELYIYAKENAASSRFYVRLDDLQNGVNIINTSITTTTPLNTTAMAPFALLSNGTNVTAGNATLDLARVYVVSQPF